MLIIDRFYVPKKKIGGRKNVEKQKSIVCSSAYARYGHASVVGCTPKADDTATDDTAMDDTAADDTAADDTAADDTAADDTAADEPQHDFRCGNSVQHCAKEDIVIGFNNGFNNVDFLRMVGENLVEVCEREGIKIVTTESNFDVEQILPNVDNLKAQGANIIIDFNVNAEVGGNLVDYCGEKGIPVIGIDVVYPAPSGEVSLVLWCKQSDGW